MPRYLLKQRQGWYAVLEVPKALKGKLGKTRFKQTLSTQSLTIAQERVLPLIIQWKRLFVAVRTGDDSSLEGAVALHRSHIEFHRKDGWTENEIKDMSIDVLPHWKHEPEKHKEAVLVHDIAFGKKFLLTEYFDEWQESSKHLAQKTRDMQRRDVIEFCKEFRFASDATWHKVVKWVDTELLQKRGLSEATARRIISACRAYWKWLMRHRGLEDSSPFTDVVPNKKTGRSAKPKRKGFDVEDYRRLLAAASKNNKHLSDLIRLGAHTGCRIEELCSLKLDNVKPDRLVIEDAKTQAGWREIPIHKDVSKLVADLARESSDGFLISGLTFNKYGDRSNAIGKRFGRLKHSLNYGSDYVFHSFRKGLARQLETNGVPENISARLLGHEINTMTYGLYSGGVDFSVLVGAISKVSWH
jgi:integrase